MTTRIATLALVSATVLDLATVAQAQTSGGRANNPEMNHSAGPAKSGQSGGAMPSQQNMGTTGQGESSNPQVHDKTGNGGNGSPKGGSEGRVDSHTQQ